MNYQFDIEHISQHIVKYGVDIRPPIVPEQERTKLQDYCNWLIEQFPEVFETLLSGPRQLQVQRTFILSGGRRVELPTFILTPRGPMFTFPQKLYIDQIQDINLEQSDKVFRRALEEFRSRFTDRKIPRVGVVNEFVFDTGQLNSLEIIASNLKNDLWREKIKNLRILLEAPAEGKNVNIEIKPTHLQRTAGAASAAPPGRVDLPSVDAEMKYGIIVNVDISNQQISENLTKAEINDILTFADDYVCEELIKFLNNEY